MDVSCLNTSVKKPASRDAVTLLSWNAPLDFKGRSTAVQRIALDSQGPVERKCSNEFLHQDIHIRQKFQDLKRGGNTAKTGFNFGCDIKSQIRQTETSFGRIGPRQNESCHGITECSFFRFLSSGM
jgi:hypothetical protein